MQTCNSVTFYFMKNSFSDVSRKWILPNMIRAVSFHEIKRDEITSLHGIHVMYCTYLVFVCRVEWDLHNLLIVSSVLSDVSNGQLYAFQESRLRSISVALSLKHRHVLLANFEFSSVAQHGNSGQASPGGGSVIIGSI